MKDRISILLVDDHAVVREGLRALLNVDGDFDIVGEAANGLQAVAMTLELRPQVVIMDLAMPQLNGLEAARRIRQQMVDGPKILILSAHGDDAYIDEVAAIGVQGYLVKQTSAHLLASAIRKVCDGELASSPSVARRLADGMGEDKPKTRNVKRTGYGRKKGEELTTRERRSSSW